MLENEELDSGAFVAESTPETPPIAIGAALLVGLAGAAVWAGIALAADYEIGWIAWGIGAAVGAAYVKLGGVGAAGPVLCGAIALASIAGGKYAAFRISVENEISALTDDDAIRFAYMSAKAFAEAYDAAVTEEERDELIRTWISDSPEEMVAVTAEDLARFRREDLPRFEEIRSGRMSEEQYAALFRESIVAEVNFADTLGMFDLLWIFLGVGTAVRIAASSTASAAEQQTVPPATPEGEA